MSAAIYIHIQIRQIYRARKQLRGSRGLRKGESGRDGLTGPGFPLGGEKNVRGVELGDSSSGPALHMPSMPQNCALADGSNGKLPIMYICVHAYTHTHTHTQQLHGVCQFSECVCMCVPTQVQAQLWCQRNAPSLTHISQGLGVHLRGPGRGGKSPNRAEHGRQET